MVSKVKLITLTILRIAIYAAMVGAICIFFTGNGEFIYETF